MKDSLTKKDKNTLIIFTLIIIFSVISIIVYSVSMTDDRRYLSLQSKANNEIKAKNYNDAIATFTEMLEYDRDKEIINKNIEDLKTLRSISDCNNISNGGERSVKCVADIRYKKAINVVEKEKNIESIDNGQEVNKESSYSQFKDKLNDRINSLREGYNNFINGIFGEN